HLPCMLVLGHWATPLGLTVLLVHILLGLSNQGDPNRQRHPLTGIQGRHEVDPLDQPIFRVVVVPAHDVVLVSVGLLFNAVVNDHHSLVALHPPHLRLDQLPQLGRAVLLACQHPRDLIVAHSAVEQGRQPSCCRRPKRTNQIVSIQVEQFFVHLLLSLTRGPQTAEGELSPSTVFFFSSPLTGEEKGGGE